jgi:hypothetical protein
MHRGLVITQQFSFDGKSLRIDGSGFDPVSLRQYLLYWDKLDWPDNNIISIQDDSAEVAFLESVGILERTRIRLTSVSRHIGYAMLEAQAAALAERNSKEPGAWSLAQQSRVLVSSPTGSVDARSIEVELYSSLPVPSQDVSLEEILEFKSRRDAELAQFRAAMDALYQETARAADIPRAKLQAQDQLQKAIQDLNNAFGESFSRRLLASLKVELNVPNIAAGAAASVAFGFPIEMGAAVGAVAGAVKFDMAHIRKGANIPASLRDYAYLHHIERELG